MSKCGGGESGNKEIIEEEVAEDKLNEGRKCNQMAVR
jgi:hypothetical protein